jgi:hypothetical protein
MDVAARDRLLNLLARTTSEHEGEALAAARKANQLLARHGLTWADVISAAQPRPPAGGPGYHTSQDEGVGNASRHPRAYPRTQHWHLSPPRRIGRTCVLYGLGIGSLAGAATALLIAAGDDGFDPSIYALAGLAFAAPTLVGFILWIVLGGWLPRQWMSPKGRQ